MFLNRRRLLAALGTGALAAGAGCGGTGDGGDSSASTTRPATSADAPTGSTASRTSTGATTTEQPSTTSTSTAEATTDTATSTETESTSSESTTTDSTAAGGAGTAVEYTDGFASVDWFDDDVTVHRITAPTRGQLEAALGDTGPRLVVFETSGTIDLGEERLRIDDDQCWIAGQTAPSPGITLIRGGLRIAADDCVVQHIRVRPGDAGKESGWEPDGIRTGDGSTNNVIDHCSVTWGIDENVSPGYDAIDTTITNCIVAEGLDSSTHHKGAHSMGALVGDRSKRNVIAGNLFAHNVRRNPRLKADSESVVANNVMYQFVSGTAMGSTGVAAIESNIYRRPETDYNIRGGARGDERADAHVANNGGDVEVSMTNGQLNRLSGRPFWPDGLDALPTDRVEAQALASAGARPADRTAHDRRVVQQVSEGTGDYVDSQAGVGGYPSLPANTRALDVPASGVRDWLDEHAAAVERGA